MKEKRRNIKQIKERSNQKETFEEIKRGRSQEKSKKETEKKIKEVKEKKIVQLINQL